MPLPEAARGSILRTNPQPDISMNPVEPFIGPDGQTNVRFSGLCRTHTWAPTTATATAPGAPLARPSTTLTHFLTSSVMRADVVPASSTVPVPLPAPHMSNTRGRR
jgi:hypothetical protein